MSRNSELIGELLAQFADDSLWDDGWDGTRKPIPVSRLTGRDVRVPRRPRFRRAASCAPGGARLVDPRGFLDLFTPSTNHSLCDLKPAYGMVFEEFTRGYEDWAFGDEDVLYGDVDRMLAPSLNGTVDLVVPGTSSARMQGSVQGHLTVVRNDPRTNELAISDPIYKRVLVSHEHWAYDETSWRYGSEISSFTKIVKEAEARGDLSIRWGLPSVTHVPRRGRWYVYDGRTIHEDNGSEILYYHWGKMRHRKVQWPSPLEAKKGFAFDRYGFYDSELGAARLLMRRVVGRVRELASDSRRRLRKWRAARRAAILAPPSQHSGR